MWPLSANEVGGRVSQLVISDVNVKVTKEKTMCFIVVDSVRLELTVLPSLPSNMPGNEGSLSGGASVCRVEWDEQKTPFSLLYHCGPPPLA